MTVDMPKELILILGGARGGKSSFAQALVAKRGGSATFIATAQAGDEEMRLRIEEHRRSRPAAWRTIEEPLRPSLALATSAPAETILLDCLTLLVSNILLQDEDAAAAACNVDQEVEDLLRAYAAGPATLIVVSNEVGLGVVPAYELGRTYRDLLGRANQRFAQAADRVYWMLAGLPLEVKASGIAEQWKESRVENE